MPSSQPLTLKLDPEIHDRLKSLARAHDRSAHYLMREAVAQYVEREERRWSFRQDALRAWEAFAENGLHVNAEEADAWFARLEAGEDAEPPECHS